MISNVILTVVSNPKEVVVRWFTSCSVVIFSQRSPCEQVMYLCPFRNHTFVILHLILQGMVYTEYTWEIFGLCQELEFSLNYLFLPYLLLIVNLFFFALSCETNPGKLRLLV